MITSSTRRNVKDGRRRKELLSTLIYIFLLSLVVIYIDFHMTKKNMRVPWNGFGAVDSVLNGGAKSPMQYRMLIPLVVGLFEDRLRAYLYVKWVGITVALGMAFWYFGSVGTDPMIATALLALFFVVAAIYDYADAYWEIALLSAGLLLIDYNLLVLCVVTFAAALNRETAVVIPLAVFLSGYWIDSLVVGFFFGWGYMVPRAIYGRAERYCEWFTFSRNIKTLVESRKVPVLLNEYLHFFVLLAGLVYLYARNYATLTPAEISLGALFLALLVPSMWREIRVFGPTMLAVIPMALRGA